MMKKLFGTPEKPVVKLEKHWASYTENYSERSLLRIQALLIEEDGMHSDAGIGPCLEFCLDRKLFSTVSELAQGNLHLALSFFLSLIEHIGNQDLFMQMDFHSAIYNLLLVAYINPETYSIPEFERFLLKIVKLDLAVLDLFKFEGESIPAQILFNLIETHFDQGQDIWDALIEISQREDFESFFNQRDLGFILITKLAFFYQNMPVDSYVDGEQTQKLANFAGVLDDIYKCTTWASLRDSIYRHFYEDFLGIMITPRLQSCDIKIQVSCLYYLSVIAQALSSYKLCILFVYYLLGRNSKGEKNKFTMKCDRKSNENAALNYFNMDRNWSVIIDAIDSSHEELSYLTLRLIRILIDKRNWEIVKLLVTDQFKAPPTEEVILTADSFVSLFPPNSITFDRKSLLNYLGDSVLSSMEHFPLKIRENSEDPGAPITKQYSEGETGGTFETEFYQGKFLESLQSKLRELSTNHRLVNSETLRIIVALSQYPCCDPESRSLHAILFGSYNDKRISFVMTLKSLAFYLDTLTTNDTIMKKKMGQRATDAFDLLKDMLKQMACVLVYKELTHDMIQSKYKIN